MIDAPRFLPTLGWPQAVALHFFLKSMVIYEKLVVLGLNRKQFKSSQFTCVFPSVPASS